LIRSYYVYIVTNIARTLYIGITNDLSERVAQHKEGLIPGFTARYSLDKLVYFEEFDSVREAIIREKQLKGWTRAKKVALISATNPEWEVLLP
jgi:putative endonuclease